VCGWGEGRGRWGKRCWGVGRAKWGKGEGRKDEKGRRGTQSLSQKAVCSHLLVPRPGKLGQQRPLATQLGTLHKLGRNSHILDLGSDNREGRYNKKGLRRGFREGGGSKPRMDEREAKVPCGVALAFFVPLSARGAWSPCALTSGWKAPGKVSEQ
jgi:hypothetical protein